MLTAEFETASDDGRRRSQRAPVSLDARIGKARRTLCKIVDISIHGARLQTYSALKRGSSIWLYLPNIGEVAADVMWAGDFLAGCQFQTPLSQEALDRVLGRDPDQPSADESSVQP